MTEKEIIFKPKNLGILMALAMIPISFSACLSTSMMIPGSFHLYPAGFLLALFGVLTLTIPFSLRSIPREIRFGNQIIVKRYIFPDLVIEYDDVLDMGSSSLLTKQGKINFYRAENINQFKKILGQLVENKKIKLNGEIENKEALSWGYALYAAAPSVLLYVAAWVSKPKFLNGIDPFFLCFGAFVIFYLIFEHIVFRNIGRENNIR